MHLSEAATRTDIYAGAAKNYLNNLKNANMLKTMFLLLDILDILANLSKVILFEKLIMSIILLHNHLSNCLIETTDKKNLFFRLSYTLNYQYFLDEQ